MFTCCRTEERAVGWYRLTREVLKLPDGSSKESSKDKQKIKRPQPLIKLVMRRFKNSFVYFCLHVYFVLLNYQVIDLVELETV